MPLPNNTRNRTPQNKERTRELRRKKSISEEVLWEHLQKKRTGFLFRRQYGIDAYSLDFYCPEVRVCVEVDGPHHEHRWYEDKVRDELLNQFDILVIRVPSINLFDPASKDRWVRHITDKCLERRLDALRAKPFKTSTPGPVSRRKES